MENKYLKSKLLKPTLLIGVLFVSSVIYLDTYWRSFGINIFQFTDLSQLVLNIFHPINTYNIFISFIIINAILFRKILPFGGYKRLEEEGKLENTEKRQHLILKILLFIMPLMLITLYYSSIENFYINFPFFAIIYSIFITNFLIEYDIAMPNEMDSIIVTLIVFILSISYTTAKIDSNKIKLNKDYKYITNKKGRVYKFLGKAGSFIFLTSLDNTKIQIFNSEKLDKIIIKYKNDRNTTKILYNKTE